MSSLRAILARTKTYTQNDTKTYNIMTQQTFRKTILFVFFEQNAVCKNRNSQLIMFEL